MTGTESEDTGVFKDFVYEEMGVEGAAFELYAKIPFIPLIMQLMKTATVSSGMKRMIL